METFQELLDEFAFTAFEKQRRLSLLIGEHEWLLDTEAAKIAFNNEFVFDVHFLGTASEISHTWLWADANEKPAIPAASLDLCRSIRARGHNIEYFSLDYFDFIDCVGTPDGHTLAMVSTCLGNASCYYRCPHANGVVVVILDDPRIDEQPALDRQGFHEAFTHLGWIPGCMKKRIVAYFASKGYIDRTWDGDKLTCMMASGEEIRLAFEHTEEGGMKVSLSEQIG